jgi:formate dehydrogenase assembly factor FdhD
LYFENKNTILKIIFCPSLVTIVHCLYVLTISKQQANGSAKIKRSADHESNLQPLTINPATRGLHTQTLATLSGCCFCTTNRSNQNMLTFRNKSIVRNHTVAAQPRECRHNSLLKKYRRQNVAFFTTSSTQS